MNDATAAAKCRCVVVVVVVAVNLLDCLQGELVSAC